MDLSILELDETPIFDDKSPDPFEDTSDLLFLPGDPFDIPPDDPKTLVMDPFDSAIPLANTVPNVQQHHATPSNTPVSHTPLQPSVSTQPTATNSVVSCVIPMTAPCSPLQENRPVNGIIEGGVKAKKKKIMRPVKKEATEQKNVDKLAQRKLRNKESARRYREKQVARRKQLENYTRTLTQQNRELEMLHERLLRLTCERRGDETIASNVL